MKTEWYITTHQHWYRGKVAHILPCYNNSNGQLGQQLASVAMQSTSLQCYTISEPRLQKLLTPTEPTTLTKNGIHAGQSGRASWFSQHVPEGYWTFEQFRNGYGFCVHWMYTESWYVYVSMYTSMYIYLRTTSDYLSLTLYMKYHCYTILPRQSLTVGTRTPEAILLLLLNLWWHQQ